MTLTKRFYSGVAYMAIALLPFAFGCQENIKPASEAETYNGPLMEGANIETLYSDSARIKIRLTAPKQWAYESGDRVFPEGIFIEFFNENGVKTNTLKANKATYSKETDLYTGTGDVVVHNLLEQRQINSEELIWDRRSRKIYTEKYVEIKTPDQILKGDGLTAAQDFSSYKIHKPSGTISLND